MNQLVGQSASFDCTVRNSSGLTFVWNQINDNLNTLFVNNVTLDSSLTARYQAVYISGGMKLVLSGIVQADDSGYQCTVTGMGRRAGNLTVVGR